MSTSRLLPIGVVGAVLCSFSCDGPSVEAPTCTRDDQCPSGNLCNVSYGRCSSRWMGTLNLEVAPPENEQGWVGQEWIDFPVVEAAQETTLTLAEAVTLQGRTYAASDVNSKVPTRVLIERKSRIPGRPTIQIEVASAGERTAPEGADFALWLTRNEEYSYHILPKVPLEDTYLPLHGEALVIGDHRQQDFALFDTKTAVEIRGRVIDENGSALAGSVKVRAATGDGIRRSTIARSCSVTQPQYCLCSPIEQCLGEFSLLVPPGVRRYSVTIDTLGNDESAVNQTVTSVLPTMQCDGAVFGLIQTRQGDTSLVSELPDTIRIVRGGDAIPFKVTVTNSAGEAIVGAKVNFSSAKDLGSAPVGFESCSVSFSRSAITNSHGVALVELIPDLFEQGYQVNVQPPLDQPYISQERKNISVTTSGEHELAVVLASGVAIRGVIIGPHGGRVGGASVVAYRIADTITEGPHQTSTTLASEDGRFELSLVPGEHLLHAVPSARSGLPAVATNVAISTGTSQPAESVEIRIPQPKLLEGKLLSSANVPVPGFSVQVVDVLWFTGQSLPMSLVRGSAVTDDDGMFRIVLSDSAPAN